MEYFSGKSVYSSIRFYVVERISINLSRSY